MMNFPLFIEKKLNENGYPNFKWDTDIRPSSSGKFGSGFYLNTKSIKYWSNQLIDQLNLWKDEWNQLNNNQVIAITPSDMDFDDERVWEASCSFYLK
jgi:hypothetical protein